MSFLTAREYRDANRHIEAAMEHLRLACHYVREDVEVLSMIKHHNNNIRIISNEIQVVSVRAEELAK
jgi:hypothetical protein